ncbi:MAG: hypothetical protein ACLPR9_07620 [Acidimicrobiales bacterium]|jgi:hypothetical protein
MLIAVAVPSQPFVALIVAGVLFGLGRVIIRRVAFAEASPWLVRIMTIGLVLHLLGAPAQIYVVDHFYGGIADFVRYTHQGALLSSNFRHFNFTLAGADVRQIVNDGSVSIATGIVMALVGVNQLATFLVFSWISFIGTIFFYRAFTLTFSGADNRRYAWMLFLMPSVIFWTADVSKEAIMMFALGLTAYGAAKILTRRRGGFSLVVPGVAIGYYIRPNELILVLAGFAVAMMVPTAAARRSQGALRRLVGLAFLGGLLAFSVFLTFHYLRHGNSTLSLQQVNSNNRATSSATSAVPYSTNLATYPRDIYEMMFNPLPIKAHGAGQRIAALENTVIIGLILMSLRQLRMVPRAAFARPYVMLCTVYSAGFIYTFAALGNLGLIERERIMMLPFLLVLLCIPRAPRGSPPRYEWELRRRARLQIRRASERLHGRSPGPGTGKTVTPTGAGRNARPVPSPVRTAPAPGRSG